MMEFAMSIQGEQVLLRAYLQTADRAPHAPTYERLLHAARSEGLAGATTLKGILGLGARGHYQTFRLVADRTSARHCRDRRHARNVSAAFVENSLSGIMVHGLITLERASVMLYRHRQRTEPSHLRLGALLGTPLDRSQNSSERADADQRTRSALADFRRRIGQVPRAENSTK